MATDNTPGPRAELLYFFCRLQMPEVDLAPDQCALHLDRTYQLFQRKCDTPVDWDKYLDNLYPLDWFMASACIAGRAEAWDHLFAARAGRSDCLLMDALRARAARLYPRDEERQDSSVTEFWSLLCVADKPGQTPILERYDGQRPLVPWLIRVFQNWHISQLRRDTGVHGLPEDELPMPLPSSDSDSRWREAFASATREWLAGIDDQEVLLLGLRMRYRMSQRDVAQFLKVHEGTISRRTDALRDQCLEMLGKKLVAQGWTGEPNELFALIRGEMHNLLLDDPRLSVDSLAQILAKKGKALPA